MRLRAPAYPLITIDPYFSVWSPADKPSDTDTEHWTGRPNTLSIIADIDGKSYRLVGAYGKDSVPAIENVTADCSAFSTTYTYNQDGVKLTLIFTSPVIPDDLYMLSRPVSYLEVIKESEDGGRHEVYLRIEMSEEICMNLKGDSDVVVEHLEFGKYSSVKMGTADQKILSRAGDDLRIEWGYFYLTGIGKTYARKDDDGMSFVGINADIKSSSVFTFAYDDIESIEYFGKNLKSYWNKDGALITDEILKAHGDYKHVMRKCSQIGEKLFCDAVRAGGEKYAEICELSFRQAVAAHKLVFDENGEVLFLSKECFSNGCAATVDVSYPSIPLFLIYNPELVKGMMRPIYRYAGSEEWKYDFAPHDAGCYPHLNGQVYGGNRLEKQMPVEECGNMLIMEMAVAVATKDPSFAARHMDFLDQWVKYLIDNGRDPENQLCTDDFAGHLAHNCNLTLKAIMGIAGYGIIKGMLGDKRARRKYISMARDMALDWSKRASNGDGSYRLAFDKPGTFSMKYNIVWDKLLGTDIMPKNVIESEVASYKKRSHPYGLPLDNRKPYSKSDWLIWTATLADNRDTFEEMVAPLWEAYNSMLTRVPATDWYYTVTGQHKNYISKSENIEKSFRNRTVVGGHYIKLLEYKGIMKL
ncbi:MAG: glutaminase domain-containing protein [Eubacteriales bacterium]